MFRRVIPLVRRNMCSTAIVNVLDSIGRASRSFLDIVPVLVCCEEVEVATYALLDPGSSMSFCEPSLIDALGLCGTGLKFETSVETLTAVACGQGIQVMRCMTKFLRIA